MSAQVVNSHPVCDPTIRQPGLDLPRQLWSLPNRFCTEQGHCGACRRKWRFTDTHPCGETQTILKLSVRDPWQNWMAAYLGYILRMRTLFRGWPVMVYDTHTRKRRLDNRYYWLTFLLSEMASAVAGPSTWNALPAALRNQQLSVMSFCQHSKTELFTEHTISN